MVANPVTVTVRIPKGYESLLVTPITVEHPAIRTRIPETMLAGLISNPPVGKVFIFSPYPKRYAFLIEEWCAKAGVKPKRRAGGYCIGDAVIWSLRAGDELPEEPNRVYIFDAHAIEKQPLPEISNACICGHLAPRGHWYYVHSRSTNSVQFNVGKVLNAFPAEAVSVAKAKEQLDSFSYRRLINLEDTTDENNRIPFSRFARDRLFIRSDKHGDHLNTIQKSQMTMQEGTPVVSFYLSRMQKRYLAAKRFATAQGKKPRFLLLKYRRGGFTTLEQGLNYALAAQRSNSYVVTLAHLGASTERIFGIAKLYNERDPKSNAEENAHRLSFSNGSMFFIGTAGSTGFGRGDTLQRVHGSEVSKWCLGPRQFERVSDLVAGLTGAASNGEVVLETTASGVEWFAATYKEAKGGDSPWTPIFLPWFADPGNRHRSDQFNSDELRETLTEEEKNLIVKHGLSLAQLSFRREQKREHKALFPQEYPEDDISCFLTSGTAYFDLDRIFFLLSRIRDSVPQKHLPGGHYCEVEPPIPGEDYVMGADTSEGIRGGDPSGFGIMHKSSGRQVAWLHGFFSPSILAGHCVTYAKRYNEALHVIERNNHGHAVLDCVSKLGYTHPNKLFHFQENRMGWSTDSATRPVMLNTLADALLDREGWNDRDFLDECLTFKLQSNGSFEADPGAHDDRVIKWAIAEQMRGVRKLRPGMYLV